MVERFTEEQLDILAHIHRHRWELILGCTGSGKTVPALETARRPERDGLKALILCCGRKPWRGKNK